MSAFSPIDLFPSAWYDASQSASVTLVSGRVSEWRDLSGNHRHGVQTTASDRPYYDSTINGKAALRFNPSVSAAMRLGVELPQAILRQASGATICCVFRTSGSENIEILYRIATTVAGSIRYSLFVNRTGIRRLDDDAYTTISHSSAPTSDVNYVLTGMVDYSTGVVSAFLNGAQVLLDTETISTGATSDTNSVAAFIGNTATGQGLNGVIGEIVVFNRALPTWQRITLEHYLAQKWGLSYPSVETVSGIIRDRFNQPCQRKVYAVSRPTDETSPIILAHGLSDSTTGFYELLIPSGEEVTRVVVAEDEGTPGPDDPVLPDLVHRIIPG